MKSVLLVDEDAFTRNVFAQTLSSRGFSVEHADSGLEALRTTAGEPFDLVVVDALLPDAEGLDFVRALRDQGSDCQVVLLSSVFRAEPAIYDELISELNVALVLHKPISPVEFCAQVQNIFDLSQEVRWIPNVDIDGIAEAESARQAYRGTIEAKLSDLEAMLKTLRERGEGLAAASEYVALLRETASRYGFFDICGASRRIEAELGGLDGSGTQRIVWSRVFDALDDAIAHARAPRVTDAEPERWTSTVLLVDDSVEFLELVQAFGREQFVRVVTAIGAEEVVDKLRDPSLDALIVDVDLGAHVNAFELVRRLRERSSTRRLPLGFIADEGTVPDRVMAAHLGASVFVEKPADAAQFADLVHRLVTVRQIGQPKVIIVDRDEAFVSETSEILADAGMDPVHVDSTNTLIEGLDDLSPDGLIVNVSMPGIGGFDLCRMVRAMPRWHDLPILLVGKRMDAQTRIAAFRSGADDYLVKPPLREELLARLQVRIDRLRLLREQASVDMLTGLLTRRPFMQRITARISEARRANRQVALALLDLDDFKSINDTYGHITGDKILAALGRLLNNRFRIEDLRGRWGGEEFVVALVDEDAATAELVLQRILEEFRAMDFLGEQGERFNVTFSAGLAFSPEEGKSFRDILAVADGRLYQAKDRGKNCIVAS